MNKRFDSRRRTVALCSLACSLAGLTALHGQSHSYGPDFFYGVPVGIFVGMMVGGAIVFIKRRAGVSPCQSTCRSSFLNLFRR